MKYSYRIMKYNKINKDGDVYSDPDEWTSFFDIGIKVNKQEYEKIEDQYVSYILSLCDCLNVKLFRISDLEINVDNLSYTNGQVIDIDISSQLIRSILREDLWCKLISDTCEIHFGYDFYMYFISKNSPEKCMSKINTVLTVQKYKSPYLN